MEELSGKLISEPIRPIAGSFDPEAMSRGEPGLPAGFVWREREYRIVRLVRRWKQLRPESSSKELYLRRHYAETVMDDGATWVVYCLRQPHGAGGTGGRWFLYSIEGNPGA